MRHAVHLLPELSARLRHPAHHRGPGPTLAGVYRNLTGDAADPFPAFKQMLDAAFPRTARTATRSPSVIPGPNPDNPYPAQPYEPEVPVVARVFWQMNPGRNVVNVNWDAISADSAVMVSASEYNSNSQQLPDGSDQRFVGAADVTVANVTPHGPPFDPNHGVTFVVEVGLVCAAHDLHGHRGRQQRSGIGGLCWPWHRGQPTCLPSRGCVESDRAIRRPHHPNHDTCPRRLSPPGGTRASPHRTAAWR